jgi:acetyl esterase
MPPKPPNLFVLLIAIIIGLLATTAWADLKTDVVYGEAAGEKLLLDAFTPEGRGPFPVCILVHGGGWVQGDKHNNFRTLLPPLGEAGFAWFSINYRLAPKHRYPACVEDVETAIRWVKAHAADYNADPKRIALIGESAGGHLVSLVAVRAKPDTRVAAVVPFYSPNDLELQARNNLRTPAWATALFGITTMDDAATKVIREASPSNHLVAGLPPFLLVHGNEDTRVAVEQSRQFQAKLRAVGTPCDLLLVQGVGHGMVTWEKANTNFKNQLIEWLRKTMR